MLAYTMFLEVIKQTSHIEQFIETLCTALYNRGISNDVS